MKAPQSRWPNPLGRLGSVVASRGVRFVVTGLCNKLVARVIKK
jgi:hypothetical protein